MKKIAKTVNVKGVIVSDDEKWIYDWFEIAATSPKSVADELKDANGEDVEVLINSGGGSVFAGSEIYTILKSYTGQTEVKILGLAASAASVIAMGGDKVTISPTAQIMIHNVWSRASGDYRDMQHTADTLKNLNKSVAYAYRLKTKMAESDLLKMMDQETWLNAQEALEKGFVDEIMFEQQTIFAASAASNLGMLPNEVVAKMREFLKAQNQQLQPELPQTKASVDHKSLLAQQYAARLNLLKLRGVVEYE